VRARQTAQIVADELDMPVTYSADLIEVGLGLLDGHDIGDPAFLSVYENMVSNWENGYQQVCIPEGESLLDVKARLERFLNENVLCHDWKGPVLLVGHAILWMSFIWAFCENKPNSINDGFMNKTHLSIIIRNCSGYLLEQNNLSHEEIKKLA
jgi:broad specificity phosphatase PhoE